MRWLLITLVLLTSCVPRVSTDADVSADTGSNSDSSSASTEGSRGSVAAEVTHVADGDSIEVTLTDGTKDRVRLLGVNANELTECFGPEGRDWLREQIGGRSVTLAPGDPTVPDERDRYGRRLSFVFVDERLINAELVDAGFAVARAQSEHGRVDEFEALESSAAAAKRGMWARDACGTAAGADAGADIVIVDIRADADGRDDQNPNDEWIIIENAGEAPVSLAGWTVKDETTSHRFTFGDLSLASGQRVRLRSGCPPENSVGGDGEDDTLIDRYWCDGDPIWNNGGDTGFVLDPAGNIVDNLRYGDG